MRLSPFRLVLFLFFFSFFTCISFAVGIRIALALILFRLFYLSFRLFAGLKHRLRVPRTKLHRQLKLAAFWPSNPCKHYRRFTLVLHLLPWILISKHEPLDVLRHLLQFVFFRKRRARHSHRDAHVQIRTGSGNKLTTDKRVSHESKTLFRFFFFFFRFLLSFHLSRHETRHASQFRRFEFVLQFCKKRLRPEKFLRGMKPNKSRDIFLPGGPPPVVVHHQREIVVVVVRSMMMPQNLRPPLLLAETKNWSRQSGGRREEKTTFYRKKKKKTTTQKKTMIRWCSLSASSHPRRQSRRRRYT
mmetsp:Transcript_2288/g.7003  ORF Transcript_2288/g.7003 Transcript_2288/m.7003 type:complete len:301 (+) Transcript_2288:420-1322(+)